QQGTIYQMSRTEPGDSGGTKRWLIPLAGYAQGSNQLRRVAIGDGLVGQCALEKQRILLDKVPRGYTRIRSSLGGAWPTNIVVLPVLFEGETKAVIELASLHPFPQSHLIFLEQLTQ